MGDEAGLNDGSRNDKVQRFFNREAGRFPEVGTDSVGLWQRSIGAVFRRSIRLRFERVFERMGPLDGCRVLDIGCGSGTYAVQAASLGAARVVGIDFAEKMIVLARHRAAQNGVADRCEFFPLDFMAYRPSGEFDFVVAMGVMDYVADPETFIRKALNSTRRAAFLSFPDSKGILALQRRRRYRRKCPLFMHSWADVERLLEATVPVAFTIEPVARDWFVTITREPA